MDSVNSRVMESTERELRVLEEIERNPHVSQRQLASTLGVALGVANACVHTLVRKGDLKIRGNSNRTLTYHLTKKGLLHKARLAMDWTNNTIEYYARARSTMGKQIAAMVGRGISSIAVVGANEAAELLVMLAPSSGITVFGIAGLERSRIADTLAGFPVDTLDALCASPSHPDAIIFCLDPEPDETGRLRAAHPGTILTTLSGQDL